MIEKLCDDSPDWKTACFNDDYHRSRQRLTFDMSVTWIRMSLTIYNKKKHLFIVLNKCKTIFSTLTQNENFT